MVVVGGGRWCYKEFAFIRNLLASNIEDPDVATLTSRACNELHRSKTSKYLSEFLPRSKFPKLASLGMFSDNGAIKLIFTLPRGG